jgi:predicted ATPase
VNPAAVLGGHIWHINLTFYQELIMHQLEKFSLEGFRSIKRLDGFSLGPITVLIGANGSGKSNLIGFFRMMNHMMLGGLQPFLQSGGGASNLLHFGPKRTRFLNANLIFRSDRGLNTYHCELTFAAVDRLMFVIEELKFQENGSNYPRNIPIENNEPVESQLSRYLDPNRRTERFIKGFLDKTRVFHFHDTSMTSQMRNYCDPRDARYLLAEGGNLAAVLLRLRNEFPANYHRVVAGVNTVFPELKDFDFEPDGMNGKGLLLRWRPTSNPAEVFGPAHLSDGTLRMIALVTLFNLPEPMSSWMIILDEPELGLHPAAEAYLASLVRSTSQNTQILLSTQSATLVDHFRPSEVVVAEILQGESTFTRLDEERLGHWLNRYTLGEAWRKNVFGGRPE